MAVDYSNDALTLAGAQTPDDPLAQAAAAGRSAGIANYVGPKMGNPASSPDWRRLQAIRQNLADVERQKHAALHDYVQTSGLDRMQLSNDEQQGRQALRDFDDSTKPDQESIKFNYRALQTKNRMLPGNPTELPGEIGSGVASLPANASVTSPDFKRLVGVTAAFGRMSETNPGFGQLENDRSNLQRQADAAANTRLQAVPAVLQKRQALEREALAASNAKNHFEQAVYMPARQQIADAFSTSLTGGAGGAQDALAQAASPNSGGIIETSRGQRRVIAPDAGYRGNVATGFGDDPSSPGSWRHEVPAAASATPAGGAPSRPDYLDPEALDPQSLRVRRAIQDRMMASRPSGQPPNPNGGEAAPTASPAQRPIAAPLAAAQSPGPETQAAALSGKDPASLIRIKQHADDLQATIDQSGDNLAPQIKDRLRAQAQALNGQFETGLAAHPKTTREKIRQQIDDQTTTGVGAFGRAAPFAAVGGVGALAGAETGAGVGSFLGPIGTIAGGVIGAIGGGILADKAAMAHLQMFAPELADRISRLRSVDAEQHPIATLAGDVAGSAGVFKVAPMTAAKGLSALYKIATKAPVDAAEKLAAKTLAMQTGFAGAMAAAGPAIQGRKPTPGEISQGAAQMLLFGGNRFGEGGAVPEAQTPSSPEASPEGGTPPLLAPGAVHAQESEPATPADTKVPIADDLTKDLEAERAATKEPGAAPAGEVAPAAPAGSGAEPPIHEQAGFDSAEHLAREHEANGLHDAGETPEEYAQRVYCSGLGRTNFSIK